MIKSEAIVLNVKLKESKTKLNWNDAKAARHYFGVAFNARSLLQSQSQSQALAYKKAQRHEANK